MQGDLGKYYKTSKQPQRKKNKIVCRVLNIVKMNGNKSCIIVNNRVYMSLKITIRTN